MRTKLLKDLFHIRVMIKNSFLYTALNMKECLLNFYLNGIQLV